MYILKWFRFIIAKIYNIFRYVIPHKLRHMSNLHIKETEISQKRSKGIKNWKITYSVILSVLSNKTNLTLGFSSPLILGFWVHLIFGILMKLQPHQHLHWKQWKHRQKYHYLSVFTMYSHSRQFWCSSTSNLGYSQSWQLIF